MAARKRAGYARLDLEERREIERGLDRHLPISRIARNLGRAPSTIQREILAHRSIGKGAHEGELACDARLRVHECPRRDSSPYVCNACASRRSRCLGKVSYLYRARIADKASKERARASRQGIDATPAEAEFRLSILRDGLARGLSPAQIHALRAEDLGVSISTLYRWVEAGYGDMCNLDLRRKVGYKKRSRPARALATSHGTSRSYAAFCGLAERYRQGAWEMDTVLGTKYDRACLLTLYHRPTHLQLALPLEEKTVECVASTLDGLEAVLGKDGFSQIFGCILTDNGSEFCDPELLERGARCKVYYCDVRASQQKGACEKNHVEMRKLLPKGRGIRFDRLTRSDCAYVMGQVNSLPRPSLAGLSPIRMFKVALEELAERLLDALGVEEIAPEDLDLTDSSINRHRARRGEAPLF